MVFVATPCLTGLCIKLIHSVLQSAQGENIATSFDAFCSYTRFTTCSKLILIIMYI